MKFPFAEVEFETTGAIHDPAQRDAAVEMVNTAGASDVLLMSHGWNADLAAARGFYERLAGTLEEQWERVPALADRSLAVIGLLWPAKQWADEDLVAGGGVSLGDGSAGDEAAALHAGLAETIDDPAVAARLQALVPALETSAAARREYLDLLRDQLPPAPAGDEDPPPSALLAGDPDQVFDLAQAPASDPTGEAPGGAAGLSLGGFLRGARQLLNTTTYYTMKDRSGKVGSVGVAELLATLAAQAPKTRRSLVGHSFGARVVSAAAAREPVHCVTLLQGAFSHHGFAADYDGQGHDGLFRPALTTPELDGPMLVTHTVNDRAVGVAYALASRLAGQQAAGIGGPDDRYGGIGRNGALHTPEAVDGGLLEVGGAYSFAPGRVYNLNADAFISGHGAVTGPQVGYALLTGLVS